MVLLENMFDWCSHTFQLSFEADTPSLDIRRSSQNLSRFFPAVWISCFVRTVVGSPVINFWSWLTSWAVSISRPPELVALLHRRICLILYFLAMNLSCYFRCYSIYCTWTWTSDFDVEVNTVFKTLVGDTVGAFNFSYWTREGLTLWPVNSSSQTLDSIKLPKYSQA